MSPEYTYSNLRSSLLKQIRSLATYYVSSGEIERILDEIKDDWKTVIPLDIFGKVTGIDGSVNSIEVFGGLYIWAISAAAKAIRYPHEEYETIGAISTVMSAYHTPHSSTAPRILMQALEAFLAYKSLKMGSDYILLDGGPLDIYNVLTGSIAGIVSSLEDDLIMALKSANFSLREIGVVEYPEKAFIRKGSTLSNILKEALDAAYRELEDAFDFEDASVDEERLVKALTLGTFSAFRTRLVERLEDLSYGDVAFFNESLLYRRYYLEPMINSFAAYGIYIRSLYELFSKLGDSIVVGASKRINWATVGLEQTISSDLELRSRIGYVLTGPFLEAPGYLRLNPYRSTYEKPLLKLSGYLDYIQEVSEFLEGRKTKFLEVLFKPIRRSILRLQIYYNGDVKAEEILGALAKLSIDVRPGSATVTFSPIELAHRLATIDSGFMNKLKILFEKYIRLRE